MGSVGNDNIAGKLPSAINITSQEQVKAMQKEMGQTGDEAGNPNASPSQKIYVNSGKSFNINQYLNTDGATIKSDHTDWHNYIGKDWVKDAIGKIDAGMKPLSQSINTIRYLDGGSLGKMTGLDVNGGNFKTFVNKLENGDISSKDFTSVLKNMDYTHKGYTSTTYQEQHGTFDSRDIRINLVLRQGTPAIITNNHAEHEILAGRNQKYNFTGGWKIVTTPSGKKQLVLDAYI